MGFGHVHVVCRQVLRALSFNDGAGDFQVLLVVCVDILGIVGFNVIMPFPGQDDVGGCQNGVELFVPDDPALFGDKSILPAGKVAPVMNNADIVGSRFFQAQ